MTRVVKWSLIGATAAVGVVSIGIWVYAGRFKAVLEERARRQVVEYLEERFDGKVEFSSIRIELPHVASSLGLFMRQGRGVIAKVDGSGLVLRHNGTADLPPLFKLPHVRFDIDLGLLAGPVKSVSHLETEGMEINIPPKSRRTPPEGKSTPEPDKKEGTGFRVVIEESVMTKTVLTLLRGDPSKPPLRFEIDRLVMKDAGPQTAMTYEARLTNPRPPGVINASGVFGPWNASEPGDTNLSGDYTFEHADLSVFNAISGILSSAGKFSGTLDTINVTGEARVPDSALKASGNRVSLTTKFEALVDGTNGNTVLKPVTARLGNTPFTTSGAIIRHEDVGKRAIELTVHMRDGDLRDILRLAMKKAPFMQGAFGLDAKIAVPPLSGKVREKLLLNGNFTIVKGMFRNDAVQDKVDELSRRGQGEPTNAAIDDVAYNMRGRFDMRGEVMRLTDISFRVPGAAVRLNGTYDLGADNVDFHGELRLDAKVSQTMTGWKRWAAIPLNPLFAKDGAGTLLKIQISGNAGHPVIGKDKGDEKHAPGGELRDPAR